MKAREVAVNYTTRRIPLAVKMCPVCRVSFEGPAQRVYCGDVCANKAQWAATGKARNARRTARKDETK